MQNRTLASRGDVVRRASDAAGGSSFLLVWTRARANRLVRCYPIVAQTRPLTRADYRVAEDQTAALGLPAGPAWLVVLRQSAVPQDGMTQLGAAPPLMLRQIADQLTRAHVTGRIEREAEAAWSSP